MIKLAFELNASAIILIHKYPSGDPTPSPTDIEMTEEVYEAGKNLGIAVHDDLIFSRTYHGSFKSMGLL